MDQVGKGGVTKNYNAKIALASRTNRNTKNRIFRGARVSGDRLFSASNDRTLQVSGLRDCKGPALSAFATAMSTLLFPSTDLNATNTNQTGGVNVDAIASLVGATQLLPVDGCNPNNRSDFNATFVLRFAATTAQSFTEAGIQNIGDQIQQSYLAVNGLNNQVCDTYFRRIIHVRPQSGFNRVRLLSASTNMTEGGFYNVSYNTSNGSNNTSDENVTFATGGIVELLFHIKGTCVGCSVDFSLFNDVSSRRRLQRKDSDRMAASMSQVSDTTCLCPDGATQSGPSLQDFSQVLSASLSASPDSNSSGFSLLQVLQATLLPCPSVIETFGSTVWVPLSIDPNITTSAIRRLEECVGIAYNLVAGLYCDPYYRSIDFVKSVFVPVYGVSTRVLFDVIARCRGKSCAQNVSSELFDDSTTGTDIRRLRRESRPLSLSKRILQGDSAACYCNINSKGARAQSTSDFISGFNACQNSAWYEFSSDLGSYTMPSVDPSFSPSRKPSFRPSSEPSSKPSRETSYMPSRTRSTMPSQHSAYSSSIQSVGPSDVYGLPSSSPQLAKVGVLTQLPSQDSLRHLSRDPTVNPSSHSSLAQSRDPTTHLSSNLSTKPSSNSSISSQPSSKPTGRPSTDFSATTSTVPSSKNPSTKPGSKPSFSSQPSSKPTSRPSRDLSAKSSSSPSSKPSLDPSAEVYSLKPPTRTPSSKPSLDPSARDAKLSNAPSSRPSLEPSARDPIKEPSNAPSSWPSLEPSARPSEEPSPNPSNTPTITPSIAPSARPSAEPSPNPSNTPTTTPSLEPSARPSERPSPNPSKTPTIIPTQSLTLLESYVFNAVKQGGIITGLDLNSMSLTGTIPTELGLLTTLEYSNLWSNSLTGSIPSEIGLLTLLTYLELDHNLLTGTIPAEIGSLRQLTYLHLDSNYLTGRIPSEIGKLTNLIVLWIDFNSLTGPIPAEIGSLRSLTDLDFWSNSLTGSIPAEIALLTSMRAIWLDENLLNGRIATEFGQLLSLEWFDVSSNTLTGAIPTEFALLPNLGIIGIQNNDLTGTVEGIFCPQHVFRSFDFSCVPSSPTAFTLAADCWKINCTCCTICY